MQCKSHNAAGGVSQFLGSKGRRCRGVIGGDNVGMSPPPVLTRPSRFRVEMMWKELPAIPASSHCVLPAALASHDYILKIVPTVYEDKSGKQRYSYQYTVANKVRAPRGPAACSRALCWPRAEAASVWA